VDIDTSKESVIDSQTGIGALLWFGANYNFKCGASIFVNLTYKGKKTDVQIFSFT